MAAISPWAKFSILITFLMRENVSVENSLLFPSAQPSVLAGGREVSTGPPSTLFAFARRQRPLRGHRCCWKLPFWRWHLAAKLHGGSPEEQEQALPSALAPQWCGSGQGWPPWDIDLGRRIWGESQAGTAPSIQAKQHSLCPHRLWGGAGGQWYVPLLCFGGEDSWRLSQHPNQPVVRHPGQREANRLVNPNGCSSG